MVIFVRDPFSLGDEERLEGVKQNSMEKPIFTHY